MPSSAMAIDGMIVNIQNITVTIQKPVQTLCSTCSNCNIKMYWKTKITYRKNEIESSLNKIFASNASKTLMYFEKRCAYGSFSSKRTNQFNLKKKNANTSVAIILKPKNSFNQ